MEWLKNHFYLDYEKGARLPIDAGVRSIIHDMKTRERVEG